MAEGVEKVVEPTANGRWVFVIWYHPVTGRAPLDPSSMLIVLLIAVLALVFGPSIWVKLVMRANATEIPDMPGTGGELAGHLISRLGLDGVIVESSAIGDHYDPSARAVSRVG